MTALGTHLPQMTSYNLSVSQPSTFKHPFAIENIIARDYKIPGSLAFSTMQPMSTGYQIHNQLTTAWPHMYSRNVIDAEHSAYGVPLKSLSHGAQSLPAIPVPIKPAPVSVASIPALHAHLPAFLPGSPQSLSPTSPSQSSPATPSPTSLLHSVAVHFQEVT